MNNESGFMDGGATIGEDGEMGDEKVGGGKNAANSLSPTFHPLPESLQTLCTEHCMNKISTTPVTFSVY